MSWITINLCRFGARVYKNKEREIGWFDIELTSFAQSGTLFFDMGKRLKVFHWHGDTC